MKIKTLFFCFLAVCAISLTSCDKNKDYTENFVGSYELTMTPDFELSVVSDIPGIEDMMGIGDLVEIDPIEGVSCNISKVGDDNDVNVTLSYNEEGEIMPLGVFSGTCDETGIHLKSMTYKETLTDDLTEIGDVVIDFTIGGATIAMPVNGKINWTSSVNGSLSLNVPTEIANIPIKINIEGSLDIVGTKK